MIKSAIISDDGLYRYELRRVWDDGTLVNFVMLNPSTADADRDDPTIRRCIGFAARWGYSGIVVTNLYAYRATRPRDLWLAADPVGPSNDSHLAAAVEGASVVAAWGVNARPDRVADVLARIRRTNEVSALGLTKDGHPRHPLYVRSDAEPVWLKEPTAS